jgi:hypothetical protein
MHVGSILVVVILVSVLSGCTTPISRTRLYDGVTSAQIMYESNEAGTHWIRPQELTYRPQALVKYETKISLSRHHYIHEAVIFGYPNPGKEASPFVTRAISEAMIKYNADGFLLSTYNIEYIDDYNDTAHVLIHGRPLELVNLGEVEIERADQERFITRVIVEENSEKGITTTTTTTAPAALQSSQGLIAFSQNDYIQSSYAPQYSPDDGKSSNAGKILAWTGGIILTALVIGAATSAQY